MNYKPEFTPLTLTTAKRKWFKRFPISNDVIVVVTYLQIVKLAHNG